MANDPRNDAAAAAVRPFLFENPKYNLVWTEGIDRPDGSLAVLNQPAEELTVISFGTTAMLKLGETSAETRNLNLAVACRQPSWTGSFGVYFGFRTAKDVTEFQTMTIKPFLLAIDPSRYFKLAYEAFTVTPDGATIVTVQQEMARPKGSRVKIQIDGRNHVGLTNVAVTDLATDAFEQRIAVLAGNPKSIAGGFGLILSDTGAATFGDCWYLTNPKIAHPPPTARKEVVYWLPQPPDPAFADKAIAMPGNTAEIALPSDGTRVWVKNAAGTPPLGTICARGTAKHSSNPLKGATRVTARIYHHGETVPGQNNPPNDADSRSVTPGGVDWQIDSIPRAAPDCTTVQTVYIWAEFEDGSPPIVKRGNRFNGYATDKTQCEDLTGMVPPCM